MLTSQSVAPRLIRAGWLYKKSKRQLQRYAAFTGHTASYSKHLRRDEMLDEVLKRLGSTNRAMLDRAGPAMQIRGAGDRTQLVFEFV